MAEKKRNNSLLDCPDIRNWDTTLIPEEKLYESADKLSTTTLEIENDFERLEITTNNKSRDEEPVSKPKRKKSSKLKLKPTIKEDPDESKDYSFFELNDPTNPFSFMDSLNNDDNTAQTDPNNNIFDMFPVPTEVSAPTVKEPTNYHKKPLASSYYNSATTTTTIKQQEQDPFHKETDFYNFGFEAPKDDKIGTVDALLEIDHSSKKRESITEKDRISKKSEEGKYQESSDDTSSDSDDESLSDLSERELQNNSAAINGIAPPKTANRGKKRRSAPVKTLTQQKKQFDRERGVNIKSIDSEKRVRDELRKKKAKEDGAKAKESPGTLKTETEFDVLPELRRGTALLKYGKHGYPHFRQFNISNDNQAIIWFSQKKKAKNSSILVGDINEILTGQHTKQFERIGWNTLTPASFSIIYNNKRDSLNLVAKSVDEMKMWVESLRKLRDGVKQGQDVKKWRKLMITVDFRDRNRPQSRKHSGNFVRSHETKEKKIDPALHRKLVADLDGLKKLYKDVERETNSEVVQATSEWKSIEQIMSEMEERIEELVHEVSNTRNTKIAENDVWRTRIDLESLREKIRVLNKRNKKNFNNSKRRWSVFNA